MVDLERTPYGYRMTMSGQVSEEDMRAFLPKLRAMVQGEHPFGLLVDARAQRVQTPEVSALVQECMAWMGAHGRQRSAVVLDSAMVQLQSSRRAREHGLDQERILNAAQVPDWEAKALAWLTEGREPT